MKVFQFLLIFIFTQTMAQQTFEIQGHRGSRGLMPENTIPAFIKALELGVNTLELDVVISKDRKVVVSHEAYFNPLISTAPDGTPVTKATQGNLFEMTYAEIALYDVGKRGHKDYPEQQKMAVAKPLLSEVIKAAEKYRKQHKMPAFSYNIEIKSEAAEYGISQPDVKEFSDLVYAEISKHLPMKRVVLQSFDFDILKYWNEQIQAKRFKKTRLSVLIEPLENNDVDHVLKNLGFQPNIWSPYFLTVNAERVKRLHELGIQLIPWTVNKVEDMKKMKDLGCDGLITDYPDRAKGL
jgi:glycerophosphoryl diester phosphodiesterase